MKVAWEGRETGGTNTRKWRLQDQFSARSGSIKRHRSPHLNSVHHHLLPLCQILFHVETQAVQQRSQLLIQDEVQSFYLSPHVIDVWGSSRKSFTSISKRQSDLISWYLKVLGAPQPSPWQQYGSSILDTKNDLTRRVPVRFHTQQTCLSSRSSTDTSFYGSRRLSSAKPQTNQYLSITSKKTSITCRG